MHDNARPHTARVVQAYLEQEGIDVMEWPAQSPDLNPIEHLSDILQRRVSGRQNPHATVQALTAALREEWNGIYSTTPEIRPPLGHMQVTVFEDWPYLANLRIL